MKYTNYFTDLTHTGGGVNSHTFPLGVGNVAAYTSKYLSDQLTVDLFKFPEDLNTALKAKVPQFLSMSNLCFNINISYAFASYVKENYPKTIVIFGGPNFPTKSAERKKFLQAYPSIDFYMKWDGEISYVNLVKKLIKYELDITQFKKDKVITENCCYLIGDEYIEGPDHRIHNLSEMPNVYLMGLMDKFFGLGLTPLYEFTRGCPYACTFCNSGHDFKNLITRKSIETIRQELEYIAKRVVKDAANTLLYRGLMLSDDNFGMYKEDVEIAKVLRDIIKKYNWPLTIDCARGKSQPKRIVEVSRIINQQNDGTLRLAASFQSTDEEILKNIKRKNLAIEKVMIYTNSRQTDSSTNDLSAEFITPLPGETIQKHYNSLRYAVDTLEASRVDVHQLYLVYGAEMNDSETIKKYKMDVRYRIFINAYGIYSIGDRKVPCAETNKVVVGNNTLSFDEFIECRIMDLLVKIFIDHDPFREVIGFVRKLNLSVFDLLITLKDKIIPKYDSLTELISEFVEKTKKPIYKDFKELEIFLSKSEAIKDYATGKLVGNEVLDCKTKAFMECSDDLHKSIKESILYNLKKHNKLTAENENYLNQAIQFSRLRKLDIHNINKIKYGEFTYDFIMAAEIDYQVDPIQMKIKKTKFKLFHDDKTLDYIKKRIGLFSKDDIYKIGKVFQKSNIEVMSRKVDKLNLK